MNGAFSWWEQTHYRHAVPWVSRRSAPCACCDRARPFDLNRPCSKPHRRPSGRERRQSVSIEKNLPCRVRCRAVAVYESETSSSPRSASHFRTRSRSGIHAEAWSVFWMSGQSVGPSVLRTLSRQWKTRRSHCPRAAQIACSKCAGPEPSVNRTPERLRKMGKCRELDTAAESASAIQRHG